MNYLLKFGIVVLVGICGCKSLDTANRGKDGNANTVSTSLEEDTIDVPPSLWSPLRRQQNASYYFLAGEYAYLRKDLKDANDLFDKAYRLDPNPLLALKSVELKAQTGELGDALSECRRMSLLYPENAKIFVLYGKLLMASGSNEEATHQFEKAMSLDPQDPEPYIGLVQLYRLDKKVGKAMAIAQELTRIDPTNPEGWVLYAKVCLMSSQKQRALLPAKRAYDLRSNDPEKVLVYAITLDLNGQSKKAVQLYETLFRLNPTNEQLIERMVGLYQELGDLKDALTLLKEAENSAKEVGVGLKMQQAFILWEMKKYDEGTAILEQLAKKYPQSDRVIYLVALGKEHVGKMDEALTHYRALPETSQYKIHGDYRSAKILIAQKNYGEAWSIVEHVIASKVEQSIEFYGVGSDILNEQGKFHEAVVFLRQGVRENSQNAPLQFLLGVYLEKDGHVDECIESMRQVIKLDPTFSSAYNFLGYIYAERGENLDEAEDLIHQALKLKPDDGFYLDSLGWVYYQKKNYDKALETLSQANRLVPDEGVILEHIADVYQMKGNSGLALDYYKKALNGHLEDRDKARIDGKIAKFEKIHG